MRKALSQREETLVQATRKSERRDRTPDISSCIVNPKSSHGISARFQNRARPRRYVECICAHSSRRAINGKFRIGDSYGDSSHSLSISLFLFSPVFPESRVSSLIYHQCFAMLDRYSTSLRAFERSCNVMVFQVSADARMIIKNTFSKRYSD